MESPNRRATDRGSDVWEYERKVTTAVGGILVAALGWCLYTASELKSQMATRAGTDALHELGTVVDRLRLDYTFNKVDIERRIATLEREAERRRGALTPAPN